MGKYLMLLLGLLTACVPAILAYDEFIAYQKTEATTSLLSMLFMSLMTLFLLLIISFVIKETIKENITWKSGNEVCLRDLEDSQHQ